MEAEISKIDHYQKYPSMKPFIGDYFLNSKHKKLLLIGESNYLPKDSQIHLESNNWYENNESQLSSEEKKWINCRDILNCDWNNRGHRIYREINRCLNEVMDTDLKNAFSHVSYMNAFQRPAIEGNSIKDVAREIDVKKSSETIEEVIKSLKPDIVIFLSIYSWKKLSFILTKKNPEIQFDFVCHPTGAWGYWNRKNYSNGRSKFINILKNSYLNS